MENPKKTTIFGRPFENSFKIKHNSMNTYLVTGASGYIASWIVKYLLEQGDQVHGTVRNLADTKKNSHLLELQRQFSGQLHLFEADLLNQEGFRSAMDGCSVILHTASPFIITRIRDPHRDLIQPAMEGTRNVLSLANEFTKIKRIVVTSSVAAIHGDADEIRNTGSPAFTEENWNTTSTVKHNPYQFSKTLAEREAWKIAGEQHRWSLVVINPGFVMGPSLTSRVDSTSIDTMRGILNGRYKTGVPDLYFGIVDVRDVARAHILAATNPSISGRHICVSGVYPLMDVATILKNQYPDRPIPSSKVPKFLLYLVGPMMGFSWKFIRLNYGIPFTFDNSKSTSVMGLQYTPLRNTVLDHAEQLIADSLV